MADFFVIAEEEIVLAFRLAGADGRAVSGREEALDAFGAAIRSGAKILAMTDEVSDMIASEVDQWRMQGKYPLIVELPGQSKRGGTRTSLSDVLRGALGVNL